MTQFIRGANPIWYEVDLIGEPLNDNYYAFFLTNTLPYTFQNVYQDPFGLIPWSNPIQFQPNGTLPNNLYFDDTLVYRIEFRKGPTQSDSLIGNPIQNYVPGGSGGSIVTDALITAPNLLTNPQFSDVYFIPAGYTFTQMSSGTYTVPIGPGWNLILTGAGTTILTQTPIPGSSNITNNPPYYLTINNSGWSSAVLQQTFPNNGAIFNGGAMGVTLEAFSTGAEYPLSVFYVDSNGSSIAILPMTTILTGTLATYAASVNIPELENPNTGLAAFVNINFNLPGTGILSFANIQVSGQNTPLVSALSVPIFQQKTYNQIVNEEFNVFKNSILLSPKDTILTGWSFSLNPYQFITTTITTVSNQTQYIADQTILHQEAASQLQSGNSSDTTRFGLQIQPVASTTTTRFALIQYIDPATILPYWSYIMSGLVRVAFTSSAGTPNSIPLKMRLIWSAALPNTISPTEPIASWPAGKDPVLSAGWTYINAVDDPAYILPNTTGTVYPTFPFNGFQLPQASSSAMTLGIMVYTMANMNSTASPVDAIIFDKISLVANEFAIDVNPETYDQSLRKCQYYYETSYDPGVVPGTGSSILSQVQCNIPAIFNSPDYSLYAAPFEVLFNTVKRAVSTNKTYSPTSGSAGAVNSYIYSGGTLSATNVNVLSSFWTPAGTSFQGRKGFSYVPISSTPLVTSSGGAAGSLIQSGVIVFQFTANACLGNPTLP